MSYEELQERKDNFSTPRR